MCPGYRNVTEGRTDGRTDDIDSNTTLALRASRGKNDVDKLDNVSKWNQINKTRVGLFNECMTDWAYEQAVNGLHANTGNT